MLICVDGDMGCDGDMVMAGSKLVTVLVTMSNVTFVSMVMDDDKDGDIATVTSADGLIDAQYW